MQWNGMKWNGMKSLAPWAIKLSRTTRLSARTVAEMTRLCPLLVSRRKYIWNALFDVPTWKKFTCSLEICGEIQEIGIETSRNRPPFHRSKAVSCTERNLATLPFQPLRSADSPLIVLPCNQINLHDGNFTRSIVKSKSRDVRRG